MVEKSDAKSLVHKLIVSTAFEQIFVVFYARHVPPHHNANKLCFGHERTRSWGKIRALADIPTVSHAPM